MVTASQEQLGAVDAARAEEDVTSRACRFHIVFMVADGYCVTAAVQRLDSDNFAIGVDVGAAVLRHLKVVQIERVFGRVGTADDAFAAEIAALLMRTEAVFARGAEVDCEVGIEK